MHEMVLVHRVVDIVLEEAEKVQAEAVATIFLTIGVARDVVEPIMEDLFSYLAKGTVAEHARIVMRRVPITVRCNQCGNVFPIDVRNSETWVCSVCGAVKDYVLNSGMEFTVSSIEMKGRTSAEEVPQLQDEMKRQEGVVA